MDNKKYYNTKENTKALGELVLSPQQKRTIEKVIRKTLKEYGETLRLLGRE